MPLPYRYLSAGKRKWRNTAIKAGSYNDTVVVVVFDVQDVGDERDRADIAALSADGSRCSRIQKNRIQSFRELGNFELEIAAFT